MHIPRSPVLRAGIAALLVAAGLTVGISQAHAADQPWMNTAQTPLQRANELLAAMTQAEKLQMLHGGAGCGYVGCIDANTRLGIPALHLQDGPVGAGDGLTGVTEMAAPVAGAATWDIALMQQYGQVLGAEQWGKGTNVVLAPTINIVRDPRWGRAFESFGEDPYLAGAIGSADIQGIQSQGPMAQVKHYAVYNQESNRNNPADNAIVSDRTEREIYLPAFETSIMRGGADSVMCSYSLINGPYACENGQLQNTILKNQWGFSGFITSDWGATHSTVNSANNGLDMEMPGSDFYGTALTNAVNSGQVSQATIDDHVRRILTSMFKAGLFDHPNTGSLGAVVTSAAHTAVSKQVAQEGSVLLKNTGPVLPLAANSSVAVIGDDAGPDALSQGGGSAWVNPPYLVTPYQGIRSRGGANVTFAQGIASTTGQLPPVDSSYLTPSTGTGTGLYGQYHNSADLSGAVVASKVDPSVDFVWGGQSPTGGVNATNWSVKWTGTLHAPATGTYQFSLNSDDGSRLIVGGTTVINNWFNQGPTTRTGSIALTAGQSVSIEVDYYQGGGGSNVSLGWQIPGASLHDQAVNAARAASTAVVFVSNNESEGGDLSTIDLSAAQNQLVTDVAAANPNTVVVVNSGSAVTMPWANAVRGIIENWYPGQEDGNAIAGLLYGDVNFSGKLPVTFPVSLADVPAHTTAQWPGQNNQVQYSEGLQVGYRWYDAQNKTPLFPFGFGLSYTTFAYSNPTVVLTPGAGGSIDIAFDVTNTGTRAGAEVPQVYVGQPASAGEPPKNLGAFSRVQLNPGQTQHVEVTLQGRSFQTWSGSAWVNTGGTHQIYIGSSSRDIRLTTQVTVGGIVPPTQTVLPRTGWTATASPSSTTDVPARMLDGNTATRWSSGTPMANGQTVTVDMGAAQSIDQIIMDSAGSANDYARGYSVSLSTNGTTWGSPVATGTGSGAQVTVNFAEQSARYIRVTQTGAATSWWSIAEFNAYTSGGGSGNPGTVLPRTGWSAAANPSSTTDVPARMLDGDAGTRWSSGTPMANGQTVTVDMGSAQSISKITMDSAGSVNDYAHGYSVSLSTDGTTWGSPVATGTGSAALVTATFTTQTARYIRVTQTGASTSWWSIAEFNAYS